MRRIDLTGQKFNKLTALRYIRTEEKSRCSIWEWQCDCGNKKEIRSSAVKCKKTHSCGCVHKENFEKTRVKWRKPSGVSSLNGLFKTYKQTAKKRGYIFDLTMEEFSKITNSNCYYCNVEPSNFTKFATFNGQYRYNGVDRMDNNLGYFPVNCVPCCKQCNIAKRDLSFEDFKSWITRLSNNFDK